MNNSDKNTRYFVIGIAILFLVGAFLGLFIVFFENFFAYGSYKKLITGIIFAIILVVTIIATPLLKPLEKYADFSGFSDRSEFWKFYLTSFIYVILFQLADWYGGVTSFLFHDGAKLSFDEGFLLVSIFQLFILIPSLALGARRLHEVGKSGWWQLLIITGIGIILLFVWWSTKEIVESKTKKSINKSEGDTTTKLRELNQLYKEGVLTKEEFAKAKKKYL